MKQHPLARWTRASFAAALTAALTLCAASAWAQQYKFGHYFPPEDFRGRTAQKFADLVSVANPKMQVKVFPAESLVKGRDALQATSRGTVDFYSVFAGYLSGSVSQMKVFTLPFPAATHDDKRLMDFANDPEVIKILDAELHKSNVKLLGFINSSGETTVFLRKPLTRLEDLKGQKIRGVGGYSDPALQELGASIAFMSAAEQFVQLETGGVDGVVTTDASYVGLGLSRVAPAMLKDTLVRSPYALLMNKRKWDKLSDAERKQINEAVQKTIEWSRTHFVEEAKRLQAGVHAQVKSAYSLSPDELKRVNQIRDRSIQQFISENGPSAEALIKRYKLYQ